jgi:FG-GAP-like repeat
MKRTRGSWMGSKLGACLLVAACTSLPDIPRDTCGNHVLEAGEDCDTSAVGADKTVCRAPGAIGACRFDCTAASDGTRPPCPAAWACGSDGICRAAKGEFSPLAAQIPSDAIQVGLSDYDGDGLQDVREVSGSDIRIRYGDPAGNLAATFLISAPNARPAAGVLTTDPLLDLAFSAGGAVAVWRGATNRTMSPTTYPSIPIPTTQPVAFVAAEVLRRRAGLEVVTLIPDPKLPLFSLGVRGANEIDSSLIVPLFSLKQGASDLVEPLRAAQLDEDPVNSPCDEILAAFRGAGEVDIFAPCRGDAANTVPGQRSLSPVTLPAGHIVSSFIVRDLNADGHQDLVVLADENGAFLAFGKGDGTFEPTIEAPGIEAANLVPLDVGFLTPDALVDVVSATEITLFTPSPQKPPKGTADAGDDGGADAAPPSSDAGAPEATSVKAQDGVNWTEARIVDLNGDGRLDVVAASLHRLDVFINAGGRLFDPHPYRLEGTPSLLSFGDFDGDLVTDLAFRERFDDKSADSLSVAFGTPNGVPLEPVSQGRLGTINVVSSGPLSSDNPLVAADGLADIGALAMTTDGKVQFVSVLSGSPDRLLQSPFVLTRNKGNAQKANLVASQALGFAVGQFTSDTHPDLAVVAMEPESNGNFETHAWLVPVTGDAQLDLATVNPGPVVDTFLVDPTRKAQVKGLAWFDVRPEMIGVDLDAKTSGALDEVVVLIQPVLESTDAGALYVLRVNAGAFSLVAKVAVGLDAPGGARWSLKKADLDADGAPDVLVTFHDASGMHGQAYFNKQNGALDPAPVRVEAPTGTQLLAWAALNADADPARELALLTDKGVFLADLGADGRTFTVAPKPLAGVAAQGNVLACGDIDGDGIDDMAIAGTGVLQVFRGLPVLQ